MRFANRAFAVRLALHLKDANDLISYYVSWLVQEDRISSSRDFQRALTFLLLAPLPLPAGGAEEHVSALLRWRNHLSVKQFFHKTASGLLLCL